MLAAGIKEFSLENFYLRNIQKEAKIADEIALAKDFKFKIVTIKTEDNFTVTDKDSTTVNL